MLRLIIVVFETAANHFFEGPLIAANVIRWVQEDLLEHRTQLVMQLAASLASQPHRNNGHTEREPLHFSFEEAREALLTAQCDSDLAAEICLDNRLKQVPFALLSCFECPT